MEKYTCQFDISNKSNIDELKKYLTILLSNNLVNKEDKIFKAVRLVHPDTKSFIPNFSNTDYTCSTTIFNSYIDYLKDHNIDDKSINYALNISTSSRSESADVTNSNFMNKLMVLSNISPDLSSEQIITRVQILGEVVFGVKYDGEKTAVIDDKPLPISISQEYDEKQADYCKLISQTESFQCYTQLLVDFEYLLCYAFILKQYASELNQMENTIKQGGKKRRTIRNNKNKKKKTLKNIKGGTDRLIKNLQEYSTFWSWLTGKMGNLSRLDPEVVDKINKSKADLKFYQESMTKLDEERTKFYSSVEDFEKSKRSAEEENRKIDQLPFIIRAADSDLEKNLKELWLSQRDTYKEIDRLQKELKDLEQPIQQKPVEYVMLSDDCKRIYNEALAQPEYYTIDNKTLKITITDANQLETLQLEGLPDDDTIATYNKDIDKIIENPEAVTQTKIINLKSEIKNKQDKCKEEEKKVFIKNEIREKFTLFFNYIVSSEYIGKEYVETFLTLCENRIKDQYISTIDIKAKTEAIRETRLTFAETVMTTQIKKLSAETLVGESDFGEFRVSPEQYDKQIKLCKETLLDSLTGQLGLYRSTIRETFEEKSRKAETELDVINQKYENNVLFSKIRENTTSILVSGGVLFLNSYGKEPFRQIFEQVSSSQYFSGVISTFIYNILTTIVDNPLTIVPTMDSFYLYLQLIIVVFITPNLLKALGPVSMDNKAINTFIMGIQLIVILSFLTILLSGYDPSESKYFPYAPPQDSSSSSSYFTLSTWTNTVGIPQVWSLIKDLPTMVGNNVLLYPSYYLRDLILKNGKAIIGLESYALIGFSVKGLFTNFKSLSSEKKRIFKEAELQLKQYAFNKNDLDSLVKDFTDVIKKESGIEDHRELLDQYNNFTKQLQDNLSASAQAWQVVVQAQGVVAQQEQTKLMQEQNDIMRLQSGVNSKYPIPVRRYL